MSPIDQHSRDISVYVETFWKATGLQRLPERSSLSLSIPSTQDLQEQWVI